jgi:hypothetical protein
VHGKRRSPACAGGGGKIRTGGRGGHPQASRPRTKEVHTREDPLEARTWPTAG